MRENKMRARQAPALEGTDIEYYVSDRKAGV
jgi:hypothetical protein